LPRRQSGAIDKAMSSSATPGPTRGKRIRRDPETTRGLILDAAERLMLEEGYAAVTTRRVAQDIGLNAATIHYYYPATDDLFAALHRRLTDRQAQALDAVRDSPDPLAAFWALQSGQAGTALGVEFLALAQHRKALRPLFAQATAAARRRLVEGLGQVLQTRSDGPTKAEIAALTTALVAIGRLLANEERVGLSEGHAEVRTLVANLLRSFRADG
jgi:TetR/AcrR family transcriptional regulator, regulator of autoinduction and epiphytic fitness